MKLAVRFALAAFAAAPFAAHAQHLWWGSKRDHKPFTCIYGEVEVLATSPTIYYCGCNWWPGNAAGGYTGIQDPGGGRHNMIFSIWDTSPTLHPEVTEAEMRTKYSRFGGEGTGAHTHLDYNWKLGTIYRYYATKEQDSTGANTLTRLYFFDEELKRWVHEATISNPNNGKESVKTFGGSMNAFLENWSGQEKSKPKLALYRLWAGTSPSDLVNITEGRGDGQWGVLHDSFYLADGSADELAPVFAAAERGHAPTVKGGGDRKQHLEVHARTIPSNVIRELEKLPRSPRVPKR